MIDEPEFVAGTLVWCNERRAEQYKEPLDRLPKGKRKDGWSCPCGRAAGLYVGYNCFGPSEAGGSDLPDCVVDFVSEFDGGYLPQYDEEVV